MTNLTIQREILVKAKHCFEKARLNLLQGSEYLYKISVEGHWKASHSTFGEFVEQDCQISQGAASKLISTYQHYVINGGLSHAKLTGIDNEKLYLAQKLPGTAEEQALRAETWTRQEIKAELASTPEGDCKHKDGTVEICVKCHSRI